MDRAESKAERRSMTQSRASWLTSGTGVIDASHTRSDAANGSTFALTHCWDRGVVLLQQSAAFADGPHV